MNRAITGIRRALLVLACTVLTVGAASEPARSATLAPRAQVLVTLLAAHPAHAGHSAKTRVTMLLPGRTPITEGRTTVPLLASRGAWLLVRLPGRPNGHTGWISSAHTRRSVTFWHISVRTERMTVTVDWGGRPVRTFKAVVGKSSTPTPLGQFFVEEPVALGPADVGFPVALALSARSNVYQEFDGGPGQIAIHGLTNVGGTPGTAVSHGCIRVADNDARWLAARIGAGVPVTITR